MSKPNDHGYVRNMTNYRRRYEHQSVWEKHYGPIPHGCRIHHKNEIKHDNRITNLECLTESEHRRKHQKCYKLVDGVRLKRCTICKAFKPESEFSRGQDDTAQGPCKPCKAAYNKSRKPRESSLKRLNKQWDKQKARV